MIAAAETRDGPVFRPGIVDGQLLALLNVAQGLKPHLDPERGIGILVIHATRTAACPLHGQPSSFVVVPFLRRNVVHELAIRLAGMVQKAERSRRFKRKPTTGIDAVIRRIIHVGKNAPANPTDFTVGSQIPRRKHSETAGCTVNANELGKMPDEMRMMPVNDIGKFRFGNVTRKKRERFAGKRNHGSGEWDEVVGQNRSKP